jgi:predicted NBD/HSP70 family sugar kinase
MPRQETPDRPTLDLLRHLSDQHVLAALLDGGPGTRADLAVRAGLSKPTVGQSVTRLIERGVIEEVGAEGGDPGDRGFGPAPAAPRGRGRSGTTLGLSPTAGCALVLRAGSQGLAGEVVTADGTTVCHGDVTLGDSVTARRLGSTLRALSGRLADGAPGPVRAVTVSVADPVDRHTGRTVYLPGAPFLIGDLDVPRVLAAIPAAPVVDNDVNWSAIAERRQGCTAELDHVLHVHLGQGIGAAIVADGRLIRGARGLAGEIAYAVTAPEAARGRDPLAGTLLGRLGELGLLAPGGRVIDVDRLTSALARGGEKADRLLESLGAAIRGACHLVDPEAVVLSGSWGSHPAVVAAISVAMERDPVSSARVLVGTVEDSPLVGARLGALDALRVALLSPATGD